MKAGKRFRSLFYYFSLHYDILLTLFERILAPELMVYNSLLKLFVSLDSETLAGPGILYLLTTAKTIK